MRKNWTSLAAFLLIMLLASAADGLMEAFGQTLFLVIGLAVCGVAWVLIAAARNSLMIGGVDK